MYSIDKVWANRTRKKFTAFLLLLFQYCQIRDILKKLKEMYFNLKSHMCRFFQNLNKNGKTLEYLAASVGEAYDSILGS